MEQHNQLNKSFEKGSGDNLILGDSTQEANSQPTNSFSLQESVKESICEHKNKQLKIRLQTLIHSKGLSEPQFFHSLNITRQHWYFLSWGLWNTPLELKLKIAKTLDVDAYVIWGDLE